MAAIFKQVILSSERFYHIYTYTKVRYTFMQNLFEEVLNYELSISRLLQMGRRKTMHTFIEIR